MKRKRPTIKTWPIRQERPTERCITISGNYDSAVVYARIMPNGSLLIDVTDNTGYVTVRTRRASASSENGRRTQRVMVFVDSVLVGMDENVEPISLPSMAEYDSGSDKQVYPITNDPTTSSDLLPSPEEGDWIQSSNGMFEIGEEEPFSHFLNNNQWRVWDRAGNEYNVTYSHQDNQGNHIFTALTD